MLMPIANVINLIIENWIISVAVLAVFASLCLGLFKGAKHGIRAMFVVLAVAIIALCAFLVYYFIRKDLEGLIKFGIAWLPTIIFLIAVGLSTLVGVHRGLRKSLILLLHSVIIAAICIGLYFFCVTSPVFDKLLLDFINIFMGTGGLQSQLGVSAECETVREVFLALVNDYVIDLGEFGILLQANSAYVLTLINMAYRLVFAVIFFIIYELLLFIMYIIYLIFYPERRYRKKRNIRFAMNRTDCSYNKRPVGGGCVGLVRGLVTGLVSLSFIGSVFFIAAGGSGASKLPEDISFGKNYDSVVSIYRSVEDYGEQGIFKILNAISDPEDTPYYLFAADIVFSGGLDDELHGVSGNIKFRKELAAYTGFAKNTLALLMKYDTEGELATIMRGNVDDNTMDKVLNVCTKPEFRVEFDNLIDNFDAQTYIINFALSLADAVVANIDDMSFMESVSADNKELLQVMFRRGYLCDAIPDERDRKQSASAEITEEIPPHLTINHLFTKKDAQIVLDIVLSILANEIDVKDPSTVTRVLIPYIEDLSILSSERSNEMDPVLGRLYCYFDNKYLTDEGEDGITYAEVKEERVFWTKEIRALMGVADGLYTMYEKVQGGEDNMFTTVTSLFDETNTDYEDNVRMYEELTAVVSDSALISKVLCSKKIHNFLNDQLKNINENIYFPQKISYENKYDEEGNLVAHGEAYHILRGLRLLADKENREILNSVLESSASFEDIVKDLAETITKDDPNAHGNSLASYLTESVLLRSALSAVIMDKAGEMIIVPVLSLETDANNEVVNLINKAELREIFEALPELVDLILPFTSEEITAENINGLLENERFNSLLDNGNKIVEGTIANALIDLLKDNRTVIISRKLENYEEWLTVGTPGELRKFLNTIDILSLDVETLMNGGGLDGAEIFEKLKVMDSDNIYSLLDSGVFYYSASNLISDEGFGFEDFKVIVPKSSYNFLTDDNIDKVIKKDELTSVFVELRDFGLSSDMDSENIIRKLVEQKDVVNRSNIISASVVNFIVSSESICSALSVPQKYIDAGSEENLDNFDTTNIWRRELPNMIGAIDEIFGISFMGEDEEFVFDGDTISEKTNGLLKTLNEKSSVQPELTRLDVCYASDIFKNNITVELDSALEGKVKEEVIASAKTDGYYSDTELRALSETVDMFNIDILNIDSDGLSDKVKKEILTINEPRQGDSLDRSTLDIMYPSAIIRYFMTEEIDKALNGDGQTDESLIDIDVRDSFKTSGEAGSVYPKSEISALVDALNVLGINDIDSVITTNSFTSVSNYRNNIDTLCSSGIVTGIITKQIDSSLTDGDDGLIDTQVKNQIKGRNKSYSAEEISALIAALDELGMSDFKDFDGADFSEKINSLKEPAATDNTKNKLDIVYESDIIVGVFTKSVRDTFNDNENLVYHPLANRRDLEVLRKQEINALISLLGNDALDNLDVGKLSLASIRDQLKEDESGNPVSYLISANFTVTLLGNTALYVPSAVYKNSLIDAAESIKFIDALTALQDNTSIDGWTVADDMKLPDGDKRSTILESEIMRATFSHHVFINENNTDIVFKRESVDISSDRVTKGGVLSGELAVISIGQLETLFNIIEGGNGSELIIPSFNNLDAIKNPANNIDLLYDFDATRYTMSEVVLNALGSVIDRSDIVSDDCYIFNVVGGTINRSSIEKQALTKEKMTAIYLGGL